MRLYSRTPAEQSQRLAKARELKARYGALKLFGSCADVPVKSMLALRRSAPILIRTLMCASYQAPSRSSAGRPAADSVAATKPP